MTEQNTENTTTEAQDDAVDAAEAQDEHEATEEPQDEQETFPRSYVQELRDESARYRLRAARADDLAAALWTARVAATGRLADPSDLAMPDEADPLDSEAVTAAVDDLLTRKPHLASRRPRGDVGQGMAGSTATTDLAGMLRSRA
ncbi:hypothetical protein ACQBAT_07795 [Ornithinimicrobium sp. Y1847]|uniref:hypothetical protein n=1 Tax=unclassified Ornithinimicrobium TaxID=2615080 RepID=UPI003B66F1F0